MFDELKSAREKRRPSSVNWLGGGQASQTHVGGTSRPQTSAQKWWGDGTAQVGLV